MSIRGTVTFDCDSCHGEQVFDSDEMNDYLEQRRTGLALDLHAHGWTMDDEGLLHCPQCCDEGREKGDDDGVEYGHPSDPRD